MSELKCINCDNDINDDDEEEHFVEATIDSASKFCHLKCFRCNICNELLTGWYFEKGGLVYCRKDYHHKYGERCRHCCNVMSGPVMVVDGGDVKFHPECFKCSSCAAIIGDDESYACLRECQLYCKLCLTHNCDHADVRAFGQSLQFRECHPKHDDDEDIHVEDINDNAQLFGVPNEQSPVVMANGVNNNHYYHKDDIIGSKNGTTVGRQYSVRILPTLVDAMQRSARRVIKLIVRDCHVNHPNGQHYIHNSSTNNISGNGTQPVSRTSATGNGALQISDIDIKYDLDHFHIGGDRLVELNRVPVSNKSIVELEQLIDSAADDTIELTLEHRSHPVKGSINSQSADLLEPNFDASSSFDGNNQSELDKSESEEKPQEIRVLGKPPIRPSSVLSTNTLNCAKQNGSDCLNSTFPAAKTGQRDSAIRKSRVNEKRNRNRERSSSLSRLLESIRLSSEANKNPAKRSSTNECCDYYPTEDSDNNHENEPVRAMPKLLSSLSHTTRLGRFSNTLGRTKSFRVEPKSYRIFRAADLVKGSLLGKGSFGEVYEVTDKVTNEIMVLKELYHNDREAEANFVREVQILKSLNHKNVLHFIGILYRGRKLNLITEFITGGTLKELIEQRQASRSIFWPERVGWARDIASGMNYLHSMSLIHRDLNSQNCLVREDGTVVVADFGLSKIICTDDNDENVNADLSPQMQKLIKRRDRRKRYTIVGNPFWMAPEMMQRNKYDERVDIYSFGIILLEIIGSIDADPDDLRRNGDFSVDKKYFLENFVQKSCPSIFWKIAFLCTEMNPDHRPPFHVQERWFQVIYNSMAYSHQKLSFRNLADSGTLFQHDSMLVRDVDMVDDSATNYDNLMPHEIQLEVNTFNMVQTPPS